MAPKIDIEVDEKLSLSEIVTPPPTTEYVISRIDIDWIRKTVHVELVSNIGDRLEYDFKEDVVVSQVTSLTKLLRTYLLEQLINKKVLEGTITKVERLKNATV